MQILNLFPTDVYIEENDKIDNKKLSEIILEKEKIEPSREMTNQGGWQSNDDLHKDKRFSEILESIRKYFQQIYIQNNYKEGVKVMVGNMWANVNRYKDYNSTHIHEGSDWSFVYYVKVPKDSGNLIFIDTRIRRMRDQSDRFIKSFDNPFTHSMYLVHPLEGGFVIFPAYLEHYVKRNTTDNPRISVSGNINLEGT